MGAGGGYVPRMFPHVRIFRGIVTQHLMRVLNPQSGPSAGLGIAEGFGSRSQTLSGHLSVHFRLGLAGKEIPLHYIRARGTYKTIGIRPARL